MYIYNKRFTFPLQGRILSSCSPSLRWTTTIIIMFFLMYTSLFCTDMTQAKPESSEPAFKNVDVFVESDWGENENMIEATVFEKTETKNPHLIVFKKNGIHQEVLLIKGDHCQSV